MIGYKIYDPETGLSRAGGDHLWYGWSEESFGNFDELGKLYELEGKANTRLSVLRNSYPKSWWSEEARQKTQELLDRLVVIKVERKDERL